MLFAAQLAPGATFNITSYGAVSGDGTSDRTAINSAITAASAGDTVYLPPGTWQIDSLVNLKAGIHFVGAGRDATTILWSGASANPMLRMVSMSDVEVSGFTLDGNGANFTTATQGISAGNASNLSIHDIRVTDFSNTGSFGPHGVYFSSNVTNSSIDNSQFQNIGVGSVWGGGVRVENGSDHIAITGNTVQDTGRGGIFGKDTTNLIIRDNTVTGSGMYASAPALGIEIWGGCDYSIVENNQIDHWLSVDKSHFVAVRGNTISDTSGAIGYAGLELVSSHDVVFTDNVVNDGADLGISISNSDPANLKERVLWAHNQILNADTWGMQLQGDATGAQKMYFYDNDFVGADADAPNKYTPAGLGIRINGNADSIVFDGNAISGNDSAGIQITGTNSNNLSFINNTITDNAGNSLAVGGSASPYLTNVEWTNNTVSGNAGGNGVLATSGTYLTNDAPAVEIIAPLQGTVGVPVDFTFSFIDNGMLSELLWDFNDGLPTNDASPSHTYATAGVYRVALVAWDDANRAGYDEFYLQIEDVSPVPEPSSLWLAAGAAALGWRRLRRKTRVGKR